MLRAACGWGENLLIYYNPLTGIRARAGWHFLLRKILATGMTSIVSDKVAENRSTVLLGANGRLGQAIGAFWSGDALVRVARKAGPGVHRVDMRADAAGLRDVLVGQGAVLCMAGVTDAAVRAGAAMSDNVDLALAAIEAAHQAGAGRVFLASSAAVYGRHSGELAEDAVLAPLTAYGHAKCEMEQAGLALGKTLGQPVTVLRIGNVAGVDAILGGWHAAMAVDQLPRGRTPARSYIGLQSLTRVLQDLATRADVPAVLNIAQPGMIEMGALLDAAQLPWKARPAPEGVIAEVSLSTRLLARYASLRKATPAGLVAEWRLFEGKER